MAEVVDQIVAEIIAEDRMSEGTDSARRSVARLDREVDDLNRSLSKSERQALDNARAMRKLSRDTDHSKEQLEGVKKAAEQFGLSGEVLTSAWVAAGFAVGAAVAGMLKGLVELGTWMATAWVDANADARRAVDGFTGAVDGLGAAFFDAVFDGNKLIGVLDRMGDRVNAVAKSFRDNPELAQQGALFGSGGLGVAFMEGSPLRRLLEAGADRFDAAYNVDDQTAARTNADDLLNAANNADRTARRNRTATSRGSRAAPAAAAGPEEMTFGVDNAQIDWIAQQRALMASADDAMVQLGVSFDFIAEVGQETWGGINAAQQVALDSQLEYLNGLTSLNDTFNSLAAGGATVAADAIGGLIESMAAGEFAAENFGRSLLESFGSLLQQVGTGMIGLATAMQLIGSGGIIATPAQGLIVGASLLAIGAAMRGFARAGGSDDRGAIADTVNTEFNRQADRIRGPEERENRDATVNVFIEGDMVRGPVETVMGEALRNNRVPGLAFNGL